MQFKFTQGKFSKEKFAFVIHWGRENGDVEVFLFTNIALSDCGTAIHLKRFSLRVEIYHKQL